MNLPQELQAVFRRHPDAKVKFDTYSPSHQREYVKYVTDAKQPQTRANRADKVVMMITGKKLASVYKPKTIPEIFGLKPEMRTLVINPPDDYSQIMSNWQFAHPAKTDLDFIHLFVKTEAQLTNQLPKLKTRLKPAGMIWVSWLKSARWRTSGIPTDVTENTIRNLALDIGLVDVKVCAVSDKWSGLKLVIPRAQR